MTEPGSRQAQKEATRQRIIDAARTVLVRDGFEQCSVTAICREADISRGLMNFHFASKDELIAEAESSLVSQIIATVNDKIDHNFASRGHYDLQQALRDGWESITDNPELITALVAMVRRARADSEFAEHLRGLFAQHRNQIVATLQRALAPFGGNDLQALLPAADLTVSTLVGLAIGQHSFLQEADTNKSFELFTQVLVPAYMEYLRSQQTQSGAA